MEKQEEKKDTAVGKPFDVVALVTSKLRTYTDDKELILPVDYSIENALKSAWLALQETVDKDKRPALQVCSQASIANALLDMAVQGLNGTMAVAERVAGASDIWAEVVYEGDEFEYAISHNRKNVSKHTQKLGNIKPGAIIAAYCVVEFSNGKPPFTEIMTIGQIKKAWAKSRTDPSSPTSVHSQFPEEMAKRTVTNRACKALINSSSDSNLFLEHFNRSDEEGAAIALEAEIGENANKEPLDVDPETGEIAEDKKIDRDPASLKTVDTMLKACFEDFGLQPKQVLDELGVAKQAEITESPADCYTRISAVRVGPAAVEAKPGF